MFISTTYPSSSFPQTELVQQEEKHSHKLSSLKSFISNRQPYRACAHFAATVLSEEKISQGLKIAQCFYAAVNQPTNKDFFSPLSQKECSSVNLRKLFQNLYNLSSTDYIEEKGVQTLRLDTLGLLKNFLGFDVEEALGSLNKKHFVQEFYEEINSQLEPNNKTYLHRFIQDLAALKPVKENQRQKFAKALFAFLKKLYKNPTDLLKEGNFKALFILVKKLNPGWDPKAASERIKKALPDLEKYKEREEQKSQIYSVARIATPESSSELSSIHDHFSGFQGAPINEEKSLRGS